MGRIFQSPVSIILFVKILLRVEMVNTTDRYENVVEIAAVYSLPNCLLARKYCKRKRAQRRDDLNGTLHSVVRYVLDHFTVRTVRTH